MIVFPQAKINIGLYVTGKRTDGFHTLESVFYSVPLHDALEVIEIPNSKGHIDFDSTGLEIFGKLEDNLVVRAYKILHDLFSLPSVKVHLHKVIPMGAGLGGGSSDATWMLRVLQEIFQLPLSRDELASLAAQLGSDCPFFLYDSACHVTGKGEVLKTIDFNLDGKWIVLINPSIHISTAEAFSLMKPESAPENWLNTLLDSEPQHWKPTVFNHFEKPIATEYPEIHQVIETLESAGAAYVSMSGSGSTVYGIFNDEPPAFSTMPQWQVFRLPFKE
jgi:4-diphosphocytidyl-2-C-methyl-D-erythritol kinase